VCKAVSANGRPTVKLSDNPNKAMGPADQIARYKRVFGVGDQVAEREAHARLSQPYLRRSEPGPCRQTVRLSGWVHRVRDHGGVLFIDLRDHYGITQVLADGDSPALAALEKVRAEWVHLASTGVVKARDAALVNPKLPTGQIEVYPDVEVWARRTNCPCRCSASRITPKKPA
jgi:lysyl-tRNA synthetase class II